jgi:hypothetical protein
MAVITVSATGGNFNATASWVGGVVPTSADDIVGAATSGQLTVNVASTVRSMNFSAYTNTITFNNTLTLGTASLTNDFGGASTNYAGTSNIICSVASTFVQNNTNRIPGLQVGAGTKTLNTNLYVQKFLNTATITINGNTIFSNGDFGQLTQNTIPGNTTQGTTSFVLDGSGLINFAGANTITISTSGQYDTMGRGLVLGLSAANSIGTFNYISGTTGVFNCILSKSTINSDNYTLNLNNPNINLLVETRTVSSLGSSTQTNITLTAPLNVNTLGTFIENRLATTDLTPITAIFSGNSISATTLNLRPAFRTTSSTTFPVASNGETDQALNIQLPSGFTHYFGNMVLNGGDDKATISSTSGTATVNLGDRETSQIYNYNFTNINASGGEQIVAINGTLSGTTNITTTYPSGGGGGGGSFTFVN